MRTRIGWAVLGLLIERPSYGHEVAARVEAAYGEDLEVSSISQIYWALNVLEEKALIEEVPAPAEENGAVRRPKRQPKVPYRATAKGRRSFEDWLLVYAEEEARPRLFVPYLLRLGAHEAIEVIDRIEQADREEMKRIESGETDDSSMNDRASLGSDLAREAGRLSREAQRSWLKFARRELEAERDLHEAGGV